MNTQINLVMDRILASGKITRKDQTFLIRAMSDDNLLTEAEDQRIKEIYNRLQMGLLKVVN